MKEPLESINQLEETAGTAAQRGAEHAKKVSSEIIPSIKNAASKLSYGVAYGTAYSGSFAVQLLKEITPTSLKDGFADGAGAGKSAAENLMAPKDEAGETQAPEGTGFAAT